MDKKELQDYKFWEKELENSIDFDFFKILFDPVRIEIVKYLAICGEKNITEIAENFSQDRSVISRHLESMYRYSIVKRNKKGRYTFYELENEYIVKKFKLTSKSIEELLKQC